MIQMMFAGAITVAALLVTMVRIDLKKCLGYATPIDLVFTALMLYMFHGTFSGIVAAASAGLFMSLSLSILVRCMGYERCRVIRFHWMRMPDVEWIRHSPSGCIKFLTIQSVKFPTVSRLAVGKGQRIRDWLNQ